MQTSTAFIFYGFIIPNDIFLPWESSGNTWKDVAAARLGINPPKLKLKGNEDKFQDYWQRKNNSLRELGITVETIGNSKNFRYVVAVKESILWTTREFVQVIDKEQDFNTSQDWRNKLAKFCELMDIKITDKPNWYLATYTTIPTESPREDNETK